MKILLYLSLLCFSFTSSAADYAVELIVFQHLNDRSPGRATDALSDYSAAASVNRALNVTPMTQKSVNMDGIWRQLRRSAGYRPLAYLAWQQDEAVRQTLRVHDNQTIEGLGFGTAYQLDGHASFTKQRFLHLALDIEQRFPNTDAEPEKPFRIFRLKQSRQIKTDTVTYFDSEHLGVLARVVKINTD